MTRQKLTDKDIKYVRDTLKKMGDSEEGIAKKVEWLKRCHGYEGSENDKCNLRPE